MRERTIIFPDSRKTFFYAFSKDGFTDWVKENAPKEEVTLVDIDDLFVQF